MTDATFMTQHLTQTLAVIARPSDKLGCDNGGSEAAGDGNCTL